MQDSLTRQLARHLARNISQQDRRRARLHLLDWLGCIAGALPGEAGAIARRMSGNVGLRTAWLGNKLEMDDVHRASILHPGPVIWAACLAQGTDDLDGLLDAAIRGYEATIAIGSTFDARHYAFWHNTTTAGVFGAAVSSLCCLEGSIYAEGAEDRLVHALGLAGSVAGGLWQMRHEPCDAKQWHIAHAVQSGMHVAEAVRAGACGPSHILEGPQGLHAATTHEANPLELTAHWRLHEVSFKPWAACRHAHPAIDAALTLKRELGELDGLIEVETYRDALTFCDRPNPTSEIQAKFSIQHSVALVADQGEPGLGDFDTAAIAATAATRARILVREIPEFTERYPAHFGARVRCGSREITLRDTRGDPERPLDEAGILSKVEALMAAGGRGADFSLATATILEGETIAPLKKMLEDWLQ